MHMQSSIKPFIYRAALKFLGYPDSAVRAYLESLELELETATEPTPFSLQHLKG